MSASEICIGIVLGIGLFLLLYPGTGGPNV